MFGGGLFPRGDRLELQRAAQRAIFFLQRELEQSRKAAKNDTEPPSALGEIPATFGVAKLAQVMNPPNPGKDQLMKNIGIAVLFATVIFGMPLRPALAQNQDHQTHQAPAAGQMPMDGMMKMMAMMKECEGHHQAMSAAVDEIAKTIASAKDSKDVAKLHSTLDQISAQLTGLREKMTSCKMMGKAEPPAAR